MVYVLAAVVTRNYMWGWGWVSQVRERWVQTDKLGTI